MLFFLHHGYRVIADDRRGHGRSPQTGGGHDLDHYPDDLAALTAHLDLHDAVQVGHPTGDWWRQGMMGGTNPERHPYARPPVRRG